MGGDGPWRKKGRGEDEGRFRDLEESERRD